MKKFFGGCYLVGDAGEVGFLMADVPEEYGGLALDKVSSALLAGAAARVICEDALDEAWPFARQARKACGAEEVLPRAAILCDVRGLNSLDAVEFIAARLVEEEWLVI